MGGADQSIYHITEYAAEWPKSDVSSMGESDKKKKFKWDIIGSKVLITKERQVMKYFYSALDKDTFDINGSKIGTGGLVTMQNSEQFKFRNEVGFSNVYEYFSGDT